MKTIYGVSSVAPINKKLKNGYTMYEWIMRQKCFPAFCLRTLCGEDRVTAEEVEYLKSRSCKIGFILRDLTEAGVSGTDGMADAMRAIKAFRDIGIAPNKGVAVFAEIKSEWSVNHNWMISFAQAVLANGFVPGFIGNTDSSKNFNFDRQSSHYVQATKDVNFFNAVFMAVEPKLDDVPESWAPYCPSALEPEDMSLWDCGKTVFDQTAVDDVYARDENVLENMW